MQKRRYSWLINKYFFSRYEHLNSCIKQILNLIAEVNSDSAIKVRTLCCRLEIIIGFSNETDISIVN